MHDLTWLVPERFAIATNKWGMIELFRMHERSSVLRGYAAEFCFTYYTVEQLLDHLPDYLLETRDMSNESWVALFRCLTSTRSDEMWSGGRVV